MRKNPKVYLHVHMDTEGKTLGMFVSIGKAKVKIPVDCFSLNEPSGSIDSTMSFTIKGQERFEIIWDMLRSPQKCE